MGKISETGEELIDTDERGVQATNFVQRSEFDVPSEVDPLEVFGPGDATLKIIEEGFTQVRFLVRGPKVILTGPATHLEMVRELLSELVSAAKLGQPLDQGTVSRAVQVLNDAARAEAEALVANDVLSVNGKRIRAQSAGQQKYLDAIDANTVVFGIGPAGTGKTYLAMAKAVRALLSGKVRRIVLTRPAVEAGESLGFLPGSLTEKIDPYLRPLYDALRDMLEEDALPKLMAAGTVEVAPLAYMRGRTLNDAFVILDEAQNTTTQQMKMFLTRLGFGSQVVVTGDTSQVDLPRGVRSGLRVIENILSDIDDIEFIHLTSADVVRHELVSKIIDAYDAWDAKQPRENYKSGDRRDSAAGRGRGGNRGVR